MPEFADTLEFKHSQTDELHSLVAHLPGHGAIGSLDWRPDDKTVDFLFVDPQVRRKGVATALWNKAKEMEPDLQTGDEFTDSGDAWNRGRRRTSSQTRMCVLCKDVFDESEDGESTGFCQSCREKEGLVTHHSWSEDAQEGHYGAAPGTPYAPCKTCDGAGCYMCKGSGLIDAYQSGMLCLRWDKRGFACKGRLSEEQGGDGQRVTTCNECKKVELHGPMYNEYGERCALCKSSDETYDGKGNVRCNNCTWQGTSRKGVTASKEALEAWALRGNYQTADDPEFAPLHEMVEQADPVDRRLHRGTTLSYAGIKSLQGRTELNLPLSSWSSNRTTAEDEALTADDRYGVVFHLAPGAKAVRNTENKLGENEYLSKGKFNVERIEKGDPYHVYLTPPQEKTAGFAPCDRCDGTGTWGDPSQGACPCNRPVPQTGAYKACPECGHDESIHGSHCENGNACPRCLGSGLKKGPGSLEKNASGRCPTCRGQGASPAALRNAMDDPEVDDYMEAIEDYHFMPPGNKPPRPVAPAQVACSECSGKGLVAVRPGGESRGNNKGRLQRKKMFMDPESGFGASKRECGFCEGTGRTGDERDWRCGGTGNLGTVPCYWCGTRLKAHQVQQDRIKPELGYKTQNVVPACGPCNEARNKDPLVLKPKVERTIKYPRGTSPLRVSEEERATYPWPQKSA